jgi:hypothetical protein
MGGAAAYSHDEIQSLVDQAASFNLFVASHEPTPGGLIRRLGKGGEIIGFECSETVHRFAIDLDLPTVQSGVKAANRLGARAGRIDFRWMIAPHDFVARPGLEPPPTPLDCSRSQRLTIQQAVFTFGDGTYGLRSFGAGRTFPMMVQGKPQLAVAAVGVFTEAFGRLQECEGNFTLCGQLSPQGTFLGHIMVRILDPLGVFRTRGELPPIEAAENPDPATTFLTWIAQKGKTPDQENSVSLNPDGQMRGLNIPVALKRVEVDFAPCGTRGLTALDLTTGEIIGREIGFGREASPRTGVNGTALTPFQFEGVSRYTFYDSEGRNVGAFTANVLEGRSIQVALPRAPDQPALRFGYFGPIIQGFGCFRGAQGFLYGAAGSVFAPPPSDHVISNMYVARISDPEGRFRAAAVSRPLRTSVTVQESEPPARKYFKELVKQLDRHIPDYQRWRADFKQCSRAISHAVVSKYNELAKYGDFADLPIDVDKLKEIFEGSIKPFDEETFERYQGPAKGTFKFYDIATGKEAGSSVLYSYWDRKSFISGERHYKQITGSEQGYFEPDKIPDPGENKVDLLANSYHPATGVTSYISMYQHGRQLRTSFAYKLPHQHEVLWFVKDLFKDGKEVHDNIFMASHEWKGMLNGKMCYLMVGIFFDIDPDECKVEVSGNQFWRALYEEDTSVK